MAAGLQMTVKVNNGDGTVGCDDAAEEGKGDGVVASESDDAWKSFAGF